MKRLLLGGALVLLGIFAFFFLSSFVYPILWWGVILALDKANSILWRESLIRNRLKEFSLTVIPASVLFWLYFEFSNIAYPQWLYVGISQEMPIRALMVFISYATTIPIIMELVWLAAGPVTLNSFFRNFPILVLEFIKRHSFSLFSAGWLFIIMPFFSDNFYLNQLMWIGPFFIFLPLLTQESVSGFASVSDRKSRKRFWFSVVIAGFLSGILWEFLNFWAGGKWQYIIFPNMTRIFEMPWLGYFGFIPFTFSAVAAYLFTLRFAKPKISAALLLYAVALSASFIFVWLLN